MYMVASTGEWFVAYSVRLGRILALALLVVLDVFLIVAFEPVDLRVALEGENVRGDTVEKPAIMRDHDRAAREGYQRILEGAQRFDVQIIGGFVEQQHIATRLQHLREMHAIAFAARQIADHLLLLHAFEIEAADIAA